LPESLKKIKQDGALYRRPVEIESLLETFEGISASERLVAFSIPMRTSIGYVPSEVLTYFLRQAWAKKNVTEFEKIFSLLMDRLHRTLRAKIPSSTSDVIQLRETIIEEFGEHIAKDCKMQSGGLDYFEVRFDDAFACFRRSVLRKMKPSLEKITVPLISDDSDFAEPTAEVEAAAISFLSTSESKLDDPAFRSSLKNAIDSLPRDQKAIVAMWLKSIPIYSKDPKIMSMASVLSCDEKTVRNRRSRAFATLKALLQKEWEE
jgi:hypothetical protein